MRALVLAIFLLPTLCVAQSSWYVQGIVGQYSMKDLKEFQGELNFDAVSSGIPTKIVTDFPMSLQVDVGFDKIFKEDFSAGAYLNYAMTKGRVHYGDYSGEISSDQNVSRIVLGGKFAGHLSERVELYGKLGLNYSILDLEFQSTIYDYGTDSETLKFYSLGVNIEPGISWSYGYKKFLISLQAGYEFNIQGKTIFAENEEAYLQNQEGDNVIINWSGFRLGAGLAYTLAY